MMSTGAAAWSAQERQSFGFLFSRGAGDQVGWNFRVLLSGERQVFVHQVSIPGFV